MERKMLEQLGKKGVSLPPNIPKDWKAYNEISDSDERRRVKEAIRQLHAQHCPPGCFQENGGESVSSRRSSSSGYRVSSSSSYRAGRFW
jgi:hypothetical protein